MVAYAVLRLRGHDQAQAGALVLRYRPQAQLVPAYVRSVERWLATASRPVTSATAPSSTLIRSAIRSAHALPPI
jgi:hypothetical protein